MGLNFRRSFGVLALACVLGGAQARAATSVAIYPLQPLGVPDATADSLDRTLRGELGRLGGIHLLGRGRTTAAIKTGPSSMGVACDGSLRCLAGLGKLLGADEVVYGVVSGLGSRFAFDLKLVDTATGGELRRVDVRIDGGHDKLSAGLRETAIRLVAPERWVGALELDVPVAGAAAYLDGKPLGPTPLGGPIERIVPGRHALRITKVGFAQMEQFVDVRFDQTTVVRVDLAGNAVRSVLYREGAGGAVGRAGDGQKGVVIVSEDGRRPGPDRDWAWRAVYGSLGVAALGLVSGIVAQANRSAASASGRPISPAQEPALAGQIGRGVGFGIAADVLWGAAAAGLVAAGVLFALAGEDPHANHPIAVAPAGAGLALTGHF